MTIREALLAMGYQERKPKKWLKPIGYMILTYDEPTNRWASYFKNADGKIHCWESHEFPDPHTENPVELVKEWECYTRTDIAAAASDFEFSPVYDV